MGTSERSNAGAVLSPVQLDHLIGCIRAKLGDPLQLRAPGGYPSSLALCIVDSIQSTGVRYGAVRNVVCRYRTYREEQNGEPEQDGIDALLTSFAELGGPTGWATKVGNLQKTSTKAGAPLKAVAIRAAGEVLDGLGIQTTESLRITAADPARLAQAKQAWLGIVGQGSGITWRYVQMLAGVPGVKPDRMIIRFVADCLELSRRKVETAFAALAVEEAAAALEISPTDLDHGMWRWQRGDRNFPARPPRIDSPRDAKSHLRP
jgi:hypothetical protein